MGNSRKSARVSMYCLLENVRFQFSFQACSCPTGPRVASGSGSGKAVVAAQQSILAAMAQSYKPNRNSARPAETAMTWLPSTVKEIGAARVSPPRSARQTSRPVVESTV